jgi:HlyD family secretion protein
LVGAPDTHGARPPWRPSRRLLALVVLVASLAAVGGFIGFTVFLRPVAVEVAPVSTNVPVQVFGLGTVGARVQSNVGVKVAGVLVALNADSGDRVAASSVLAQLDAREVAAQLGQARAGVLQAQASLVKAHADVEEAESTHAAELTAIANLSMARSEVDVATASVKVAEAQVAFQEAALDNYTLRSPYDALVVARNLQLGAMPVPGQAVFTLVDPATIWVQGYVDERLAGGITLGQPAEIVLRSEPGRRHPGHVARIEIQSDAVNEERLIEVAFDSIPRDIHLAEQAEVVFTTGSLSRAVLVPQVAVSGLRAGRGTVWTIDDGKLAKRNVTVGAPLLDGRLPITDPVPLGVQVIVSPTSGLRAGRDAVIARAAPQ